jgi:hypothetical protein
MSCISFLFFPLECNTQHYFLTGSSGFLWRLNYDNHIRFRLAASRKVSLRNLLKMGPAVGSRDHPLPFIPGGEILDHNPFMLAFMFSRLAGQPLLSSGRSISERNTGPAQMQWIDDHPGLF